MTPPLGFRGRIGALETDDPGLFVRELKDAGIGAPPFKRWMPIRLRARWWTPAATLYRAEGFAPGASLTVGLNGFPTRVQVWSAAPGNGVWVVTGEGACHYLRKTSRTAHPEPGVLPAGVR